MNKTTEKYFISNTDYHRYMERRHYAKSVIMQLKC